MSTLKLKNVLESACRFCMLPNEDISRIPWYEWQDSPIAAMYESLMKQELPHVKECLEVCYCNKCAELLCQTVYALQMFQRSDTYWRNVLVHDPVSSSADVENPDIVAEYLEEEDIAEISGLNMNSLEVGSVKIELVDVDYEDHTDFIGLHKNEQEKNKYHDFWKMIYEDEQIDIETEMKPIKCTNNDSPRDKKTTKEINSVKSKSKLPDASRTIKKVKPKIMRDDKLPCLLCDEIFPNRASLNRHTDATHNMVQCIRCPFTTTTRQSMRRHELVEHKRTMDSISPCTKCSKIFTDPHQLRMHNKYTHAPLVSSQCHVCSLVFKSSFRLKNHMKHVHVEAIYECDICKKKFRQKKNLKVHMMNVHVRDAKFICKTCGRTFTNQITWKLHESRPCSIPQNLRDRNYDPNPIFSCSVCFAKFTDLNYGRLHYQKVHQIADVSNVCMICNYLTATPDELNEHLSVNHSSLSCSICKRFFKSQISLKSHIATHSKKERPFECAICKATFVRAVHVRDHHKRIHSGGERSHKCTDCDLMFVTNCEMLAHWRHIHDLNRKFKCNWCEKRYVTITQLSLHEAVHTGIGKYNCDLCRQNFRLVHQLVKHFQRNHPDHKIR